MCQWSRTKNKTRASHRFQVIQDAVIDAILLKIDTHGVNDLGDDNIVDRSDCRV